MMILNFKISLEIEMQNFKRLAKVFIKFRLSVLKVWTTDWKLSIRKVISLFRRFVFKIKSIGVAFFFDFDIWVG